MSWSRMRPLVAGTLGVCLGGLAVLFAQEQASAQLSYQRGQNVSPAFEGWEANEDGSVWTFKLNPNGKFSDGTPVTAQDFIYAWNRIASTKTKNTSTGEPDPSVLSYHLAAIAGTDEPAQRIDGPALAVQLKVQPGPCQRSRVPHVGDHLPDVDLVAGLQLRGRRADRFPVRPHGGGLGPRP